MINGNWVVILWVDYSVLKCFFFSKYFFLIKLFFYHYNWGGFFFPIGISIGHDRNGWATESMAKKCSDNCSEKKCGIWSWEKCRLKKQRQNVMSTFLICGMGIIIPPRISIIITWSNADESFFKITKCCINAVCLILLPSGIPKNLSFSLSRWLYHMTS